MICKKESTGGLELTAADINQNTTIITFCTHWQADFSLVGELLAALFWE